MKKIVSFMLCALMLLSVVSFPIFDKEASAVNPNLEGYAPINLGDDFYAHIRNTWTGKYVTDKNNNVCLSEGAFDKTQTWHFVRQENGAYVIATQVSGYVMDVVGANFSDGANVQMHQANGSEAQQFFIYYIENNFFFKSAGDKTLDANSLTGNIQLYGCETGIDVVETKPDAFRARSFEIFKIQLDLSNWNSCWGSEYEGYIRNSHSGLFMTAEGDNVVFRGATYGNEQKWNITRNEYGGHIIKSVSTGKVLDVESSSLEHGANINLHEANGSKEQAFFFINTGESRVYIKPSYTNTVVDMDANNHEIHTCSYGGQPENIEAQVFEIVTEMHISNSEIAKQPKYLGEEITANIVLNSTGEYLTDNTSTAVMKRNMGNQSQVWTLQYDSSWNAYTIIGSSGKALDVSGAGYHNGTKISLWRTNTTAAQRFRFYEDGNGYIISPAHSQKLVDVASEDGTSLQIYGVTPNENNKFSLVFLSVNGQNPLDLGDQFESVIKNKASGLYVTGKASGTLSCTSSPSKWKFIRQANGSYVIRNDSFGKVFDVASGMVSEGAGIQLYDPNGTLAQSFFIYKVKDGFELRCAKSGKVIDMDATTKEIHTYSKGSATAQTFVLDVLALKATSSYKRDDAYVKRVPSKTPSSQVISQFEGANISVFDKDGNVVANDMICGTGYSVKLMSGANALSALSVIVLGDVDGNGIVDSTDYVRIKTTFLGKYNLDGVYFVAGDVDGNGSLNSTDYLRIKSAFLDMFDLNDFNDAYDMISEKEFVKKTKDPAIDKNPESIINYLNSKKYLLKSGNSSAVVSRLDFATNVVLHSGFYSNFAYYYPVGDYSEFGRFTDSTKFAEIAVNQGYMVKPQNRTFRPNEGITYEEVLRGYLYVLGYREYADQKGYLKLARNIGLTEHISGTKPLTETVTYGEYAQIVYNALHLPLALCVEIDGAYYITARENLYIADTYIARTANAAKTSRIFKLANSGWDIFNPPSHGGYKYGPSMIINDDGSIDLWAASHSGLSGEIDYGTFRTSYDGGKTWTADKNAVQPTAGTEDWNWSCDPAVIKVGEWYYAFYTSTIWHDGLDNNLFVGRSKTPEGPFVEKWSGNSWGVDPKPIAIYDGDKTKWGMGADSCTLVGDTLYIYCSLNSDKYDCTLVYTAPANDENWPAKMKYEGIAYSRNGAEDSTEVKYVDAYNQFISVATAGRFTNSCYINIRSSFDGKFFRYEANISHLDAEANLVENIHNMGISGDEQGHVDIFKQNYVAFSYQPEGAIWGRWPTRFVPIVWYGTHLYDKPSTVVQHKDGLTVDTGSSPQVCGTRMLNAWNERTFRVQSESDEMLFYIQQQYASGLWEGIPESEYANVVFYYDPSIVSIDIHSRRVRLLSPQVHVVRFTYKNQTGYFTVLPDYGYHDGPVEFYPETPVVTFTRSGEAKQPGFVAKGSSGDRLVLWGNLSSYTDANTKDQPEYIKRWQQNVSLSGWDSRIISVDTNTGKITAKAVGETTITATYMGKTAKIKIVVQVV